MSHRRVAIVGVGCVSALGQGFAALASGVRDGRSGLAPLTLFDPAGFRSQIAGQVRGCDPQVDAHWLHMTSRADRFALAAAAEAVRAAWLEPSDLAAAAVVLGTGTGGAHLTEDYVEACLRAGEQTASPELLVPHQPANSTDLVARCLGALGPRLTLMTACSSSATALGYAADLVRLGRAEVAIAGGSEALCRLTLAGFGALRALDPAPCRPFDARRQGLNLGEGAAMLVLEEVEHARARGARVWAHFLGYGVTADAHHMTAPDPAGDGAARAMRAALEDAGLFADAVDYVNAHGTATPANDPIETAAIHAALGARARCIPVSSSKSAIGHTLGAAGALEAAICVAALQGGFVPPTLGHVEPDPACDLDYVPGAARPASLGVVLSDSLAFGGHNTCLALGHAERS